MSKVNKAIQKVRAFAPASCANVAVGFDILGFALEAPGDYVTLSRREDRQIVIESIHSPDPLPATIQNNTASLVVQKLCESLNLDCGFSIRIEKGIPLCSGMGGSAASAVAALVACNHFLTKPLSKHELAHFALFGELEASGAAHPDNIVPCLFGGLTLIHSQSPMQVVALPVPDLFCVLIHPHLTIATRDARQALAKTVSLSNYVNQSASLASFVVALYEQDFQLLRQSMNDILIEPQRAHFVPGFYDIQDAARQAGALGMSLSGSGPALFSFARTREEAEVIAAAMRLPLAEQSIASDCWISPISKQAAHVVREEL